MEKLVTGRLATAGLLAVLLPCGVGAEPHPAVAKLQAFVGHWQMTLQAETETFGERGGAGSGHMACEWGPMQAWIDCTLDSAYENMGRYVLKIVLFPQGSQVGAFVTNSFGGGRLYTGQWRDASTLVYDDAWVDESRTWPYQRVTYRFASEKQLTFAIEVSRDGDQYLPHSSGRYQRANSP